MRLDVKNIISSTFGKFGGTGSKDQRDAFNRIYRERLRRLDQDVSTWRRAIERAEDTYFPQRLDAIQLYQDTVLNAHVFSCLEKRRRLTLLKDWSIVNGETENERLEEMLDRPWFSQTLKYILDAKFYGYSLVNFGDIENNEFVKVVNFPREYIVPERKEISSMLYSPAGTKWEGTELEDWVLWVPTVSESTSLEVGMGLLYYIGLYEIHLRHLTGFNADYVEMFGQPLRVAKTDKSGASLDDFEDMMANLGSSGWGIIGLDDEIDLKQPSGSGESYKSYSDFEKRLEQKISKVILGHADAMDSTPGKLGSEQGEDSPVNKALREVEQIDTDDIEEIVNSQLFPKLRKLGFPIGPNDKFRFENDKEQSAEESRKNEKRKIVSEYVERMSKAGYSMNPEELSEIMEMEVFERQNSNQNQNEF